MEISRTFYIPVPLTTEKEPPPYHWKREQRGPKPSLNLVKRKSLPPLEVKT
jgi:hypothetical protein